MENQSYSFRSALHGFHRGDVIAFLARLSASHEAALRQRDEELRVLREELAAAQEKLKACAAAPESGSAGQTPGSGEELEAYRRAERCEREAKARAEKLRAGAAGTVQTMRSRIEQRQAGLRDASDALGADFAALQKTVSEILNEMNDAREKLGQMEQTPSEE